MFDRIVPALRRFTTRYRVVVPITVFAVAVTTGTAIAALGSNTSERIVVPGTSVAGDVTAMALGARPSTSLAPMPTSTAKPKPTTTTVPRTSTTLTPMPTSTAKPKPTTTTTPKPTTTTTPKPTTTTAPAPTTAPEVNLSTIGPTDGITISAGMAGIWVTSGYCAWALNDASGNPLSSWSNEGQGLVELRAGDFFRTTCGSFTRYGGNSSSSLPAGMVLLSGSHAGTWAAANPDVCGYWIGSNNELRSPGTSGASVQYPGAGAVFPGSGVLISTAECGGWTRIG